MSIRLANLRMHVEEPEAALPFRIAKVLGVPRAALQHWRILRKSLDARDKRDIAFVYTTEVKTEEADDAIVSRLQSSAPWTKAEIYSEPPFELPEPGQRRLTARPVIVGTGPAGLFAGLFLAERGYQPLLLERGRAVRERINDVRALEAGGPIDPESNYLFGEGGAGTFSDGKLTCRLSGPDVRKVLEVLAESKGKPAILYEHRPHLGSNRLPAVVKALRQRIERAGGEFRFGCRMEDVDCAEGHVRGVNTSSGAISANVIVLAMGHSARDTIEMLHNRGVPLEQKPFQFGVRIEQPQASINRAQYGVPELENLLGAADYSVVGHGSRDVFSFCMCAGGQVIPSVSELGYFATNGMSLSKRNSPWANSGMMVTVGPEDFGSQHVLAGMWLQRHYEKKAFEIGKGGYVCPIQRVGDFLRSRRSQGTVPTSFERGTVDVDLNLLLPTAVIEALHTGLPQIDRKWRGAFLRDATLVGPESRGSSPIRIPRDRESFETTGITGLYPIGEGAGYAGGIVSAAVDGLRCAKAIIRAYSPLER